MTELDVTLMLVVFNNFLNLFSVAVVLGLVKTHNNRIADEQVKEYKRLRRDIEDMKDISMSHKAICRHDCSNGEEDNPSKQ